MNPWALRPGILICQKHGPFLGTLNIRCRTILGTQKGTITLTTTHIGIVLPQKVEGLPTLLLGLGLCI